MSDAGTLAHFDTAQIAMLRGLRNGALLPQLLRLYREQAPGQLAAVGAAAAAGDAAAMVRAAHVLKSASFSVGARRVGELCAALEAEARGGALHDAVAAAQALEAAFAALQAELASLL
jgi:HPt (histidine-containing phosphotransfer) domain-containing protein